MHRSKQRLFDHLVGACERHRASRQPLLTIPPPRESTCDRRWQCFEAERLRGLEVGAVVHLAWCSRDVDVTRELVRTSRRRANTTPDGHPGKRSRMDWMWLTTRSVL